MFKSAEILKELKSINKKLDKLILLERGGKLKDLSIKRELSEYLDSFLVTLAMLASSFSNTVSGGEKDV